MYAIWAVTTAIMEAAGNAYVVRHGGVFLVDGVMLLPAAVAAGVFGAAKFVLARTLADPWQRTRKIAIGVEIAMACLGALTTASAGIPGGLQAGLFTLAAFVGGILSLAAALGLLRRPARQFFTEPGPADSPGPDSSGGRTAFSAPISTLRRYRVLRPA